MIEAPNCVICDGEIHRLKRALVAPFLAKRIWDRPPFCVDVVQCRACGFTFYNPRLNDAEEGRLYAGYRSEEYLRMRHASEAWYTERFNSDLGSSSFYELRRRALGAIIREHAGKRGIRRVLDYGGNRGDLVHGLVDDAAAFVYDISGIPAVDGVTSTSDPAGCKADLIINSNVLEHVGFPRRLVGEILEATPPGGMVFLEVPCESPFQLSRIFRRIAQIGIMALTRPSLALSVVRPASLYMMHEHINYFTEQSLSTLMRSCGFAVVAAGAYVVDSRSGKGHMAWCLGTVT
jgi:SAM-dependent methyltransferase